MIKLSFDGKNDSLEREIGSVEIEALSHPKNFDGWNTLTKGGNVVTQNIESKDNFIFKGDNLFVLYSLIPLLENKLKLIYVDPPYNKGRNLFGYKDRFDHDEWLRFMKNRLEVCQKLLTDIGTIFISIDMHEMAYLKILCDEIFGRKNFVGEIIWETSSDNNARQISNQHEYVLCYAKDKKKLPKWKIKSLKADHLITKYKELKSIYNTDTLSIQNKLRAWIKAMRKNNETDLTGVAHYSYVDEKGIFYPGNSSHTRPNGYFYELTHPISKKSCRIPKNGYRWLEETFWKAEKNGDVMWPKDESGVPRIKKRIDTATELLKGYHYEDNRSSSKELKSILGEGMFHNPKSLRLLEKIIRFASGPNDLILDIFSGSGSMAHAILNVNNADKTKRRFMLIEQNNFVEKVIIPRLQKTMSLETIHIATLEKDKNLVHESQSDDKSAISGQFHSLKF